MKKYAEDDFLMLSGIQHFAFCRRQWALIHIEQQWAENVRTAEGALMHERAHDPKLKEKSKNMLVVHALPVSSENMGISGECDVVEFHKVEDGIRLYGHRGLYRIYPVEYKRGRTKSTDVDRLQLTAQAMCLEEMLCCDISYGYIFYGETRHRMKVEFTDEVREKVRKIFSEMHKYYEQRYTPKVKTSKKCNACSLKDICIPALNKKKSVSRYIDSIIAVEEKE